MTGMHRGIGRRAVGLAVVLLGVLPAVALAHPLGNFTINHYAAIRVEPERVLLDIVIDEAEIPAFQARQGFDADGDGSVSDEELDTGRLTACETLRGALRLSADDTALALDLQAAGLSFPLGTSGLSTMRLVCGFTADLPAAVDDTIPTRLTFADASDPDRLGWREIVVTGSGTRLTVVDGSGRSTDTSDRLTAYPTDRIAQPLADQSVTVDAVAGAETLPPWEIRDATAVPGARATPTPTPDVAAIGGTTSGAVPGGVQGELPSIFSTANLTPVVLLLSLVTAVALGAGHALTPGHGKTLMAAYLVGTRGTPLHALGLGLAVSVSHTVGILVLAAIVIGAADVLPPDLVVRAAPVVAAISILGIGAWMLVREIRHRRSGSTAVPGADRDHEHDPAHDHDGGHEHSHGGVAHRHVPAAGSTITWRSLFVLGLAGGLIPSTSALLILLGSIAAGRPAYGLILVVAFGIGMATVMGGIGLAMVVARDRVDRLPGGPGLGRARELVPLVAAVLVFGFGIYLTVQAVGGAPTL